MAVARPPLPAEPAVGTSGPLGTTAAVEFKMGEMKFPELKIGEAAQAAKWMAEVEVVQPPGPPPVPPRIQAQKGKPVPPPVRPGIRLQQPWKKPPGR